MPYLIGTSAALLGLIPLLWLAFGPVRGAAWWWMAGGFAVSFVADAIARVSQPAFVSQLYPVTQAAVFVLVLAPKRSREWILGALLCAAAVSVALRDAQGFDVLLRTVAWGIVAVLALSVTERLRMALLVYFALGAVLWTAYVLSPGWVTWLAYQGTRALGVSLWCMAAWHTSRRVGPLSMRCL